MRAVQELAGDSVARVIRELPEGSYAFRDRLDDGTPIAVTLRVAAGKLAIDFGESGARVDGQPERAARRHAGRRAVRAARPGRPGHPAQ